MIVTARQLEEMWKARGEIALGRGARLTPLAQDWIKRRKLAVVYSELKEEGNPPAALGSASGKFLWWCDGPCGTAKAALSAHRDVTMSALQTAADSGKTLAVVKEIAKAMKGGDVAGAIVFVQSAGAAMLYLNRCASLRAVLGTNLQGVDAAMRQIGANVLVMEYGGQTLQQMKNLIGRFLKGKREVSAETLAALKELSCE